MARSVTLSDVLIDEWTVNLNTENVTVRYRVVDDNGWVWADGLAVFWRNIPQLIDPNGNPAPIPDNWFQLPTTYVQTLNDLNTDIHTALLKFVS